MRKAVLVLISLFLLVNFVAVVSAECTDSDNGNNSAIRGKACVGNDCFTDECCSSGCVNGINLLEFYCKDDGKIYRGEIKCDTGCFEGACISETNKVQECSDTDGGIRSNDVYVKGKVTGLIWDQDPAKRVYTEAEDYCISNDDSRWASLPGSGKPNIAEYFCAPGPDGKTNYINVNGYQCDSGQVCKDGACLQSNTTTTPVCQSTKCSDGTVYECKIVNNQCECPSCPPKPTMPKDMDSCLNNPDYYWDQRTNSCLSSYPGCIDPDGGKNIFEQAHTFGLRSSYADSRDKRIITGGSDSCISEKQLIEHYCDNNFIQAVYLDCPNGCSEGACIKGEPITEKITCKFEGTDKEQRCYLAGQFTDSDLGTKFCIAAAGPGSCVIAYTGYKGEQVTWKSSCGGYQYTTIDGNDEKISFDCLSGETNITQVLNKGFRNVYFQCYDGEEKKATSATSATSPSVDRAACKSYDYWKKFAINFCESHCDKKTGKCGVNTFSIGAECYIESDLCRPGETGDECCNRWAKENNAVIPTCFGGWNIENDKCSWSCKETPVCGTGNLPPCESTPEPSLVCKDSCPLEGKCYPFGYRKSGKYCSDEGGFIAQKKNEACDNSFECASNVCVNSKCIDEGFLQKIMNWFKRLFGGK